MSRLVPYKTLSSTYLILKGEYIMTNFEKAFDSVFGAAVEANKKYGKKIKHPVTGEMVYEQQIRFGKSKKDNRNK